ncbi:MAG: hypothetical protein D8M58_19055 [Calditrichaeota bacterium]|nr:MAG: hypothetical protein DWQ03_21735 [Calditrichota bacterium]MBL1207510.1 hypothetical protein [Calditrichota bacterium]
MLFSFGISFFPFAGQNQCAEDSCVEETTCEMPREMTCCEMDEMEKESCQCPEMTDQDKTEKENIPAVPATKTTTKLIANIEFVTLSTLESTGSSKNFSLSKASQYSTLSNKIYKKINTFLI